MYLVAAIFLVFSGAAALTYQVTWVRLLGLSMGSTSASISTVLAAFFLGMALGSYFAGRFSRNKINSFSLYIKLELAIAITGLSLLPILLNLDSLIASVPLLNEFVLAKFSLTLILLSIPTICMGATFPVMAAILIRREQDVGLRISQLYSLNTVGAILGAILAGFVFIPQFGLDGAIYIAVGLNLFVVLAGWILNSRVTIPEMESSSTSSTTQDASPATTNSITKIQCIALLILIGTGFASIASEIGWTKYLSIFTGTTIYGFSAILGIFLMGIAGGSWAIKNKIQNIKNPQIWLATSLLIAAAALIYSRTAMSFIPVLYEGVNSMSITGISKQWLKYLAVFGVIFPPTFVLGAIFPLNIKLFCGDLNGVQARVGKAYAANTVASIAGSIVAGFWIIPQLGTDTLLVAMYILVALLPLLLVYFIPSLIQKIAVIVTTFSLIAISTVLPPINYEKLIASVAYKYDADVATGNKPDFLFVKEGKVSVISMVTYDHKIAKVQANGLNESLIDMTDPSNALIIESMLAYIPYMIHEKPESVFVVGYGGGITTRAFTHTDVKSIRVVELEPAVIEAGRTIPNGPITALDDPRVTLSINDARNTLLVEKNKYDIIAAQPSHPWLAGASSVFTQEFFHLVKTRLNDDGIFTQWINLFRMDVTTLRSLLKAFYSVFPEGVTFANLETGDLMLVGSSKPILFDFNQMKQRMNPKLLKTFAHYGVSKPVHLLWYFALSREEAMQAAGDITPNTDTNIFSEVRLSALLDKPDESENPYLFLQDHFDFDIVPYLQESSAKNYLYEAGKYFLSWNAPDTAFKVAKQLHKLDKTWGRSFKHQIYYWRHDWKKATQWYDSHQIWLDSTHITQLEIFLEQQDWQKSLSAINNINNIKQRRLAFAMLLFSQQKWQELAETSAISPQENIWVLLGKAKLNLHDAAIGILPLVNKNTQSLPIIRLLIRFYDDIDDEKNLLIWNRKLIKIIDNRLSRYNQLAELALSDNDVEWNLVLLNEIARINPNDENLKQLKQQREKHLQ